MPVLSNKLSSVSLSKTLSFRSRGSSSPTTTDSANIGSGHSSTASKHEKLHSWRSNRDTINNPPYPVSDSLENHSNRNQQGSDLWGPPPYTPAATTSQTPYSPASIQSTARPRAFPSTTTTTTSRTTAGRTTAGRASDDTEYAFLGNFDTIFVVDDSGSMRGQSWKEAEEAIAAITPVCTQYDPDGIDIYFLNHYSNYDGSGGYKNVDSPGAVQEIFRNVRPHGMTPVGRRLREILHPYLRQVEKMAANTNEYGRVQNPGLVVRPINVIVITDGAFSDDAESVILNAARTLDKHQAIPWQIGIQFFQIGTDPSARKYLEQLDDELGKAVRNEHVRDIVDTVPWKGQTGRTLSSDGILKVVLGAVDKRLDRQRNEA